MGGTPFPDGEEPENHSHSHGAADEEFASVVFDEDFVRSAEFHEPTAVERMLAAAQARAEAEAARARGARGPADDELYETGYRTDAERDDPDAESERDADDDGYGPYGPFGGVLRPYRSRTRWHRPVAWALALLMGIGMVALAFAAVYRGASANRQDPAPPPATSGVDTPRSGESAGEPAGRPGVLTPVAPVGSAAPTLSAVPRTR